MRLRAMHRVLLAVLPVLALTACETNPPPPPPKQTPRDSPTRGFPAPEVHESVYLPVDRATRPPAGYGLYTVLLTRTANRNTVKLLSELFATTGSAGEAMIARENLNLITIPVKSATDAAQVLASARNEADAAATAVMERTYDFNHAALLMASVCRPDRGAAVMKACGSAAPDGPLLVTAQLPMDGSSVPGQRLLIVNLSTTPPEAIGEVLAAYRRQILREDFADRSELDGWRLRVLNHVLDAAHLLPGISKAYAGS
jgi:hypothetical protein